jgi:hypothetical protein
MKGIPTLSRSRLKRAAAVAGVGALVLGGALLSTSQAHAASLNVYGTGTGLTISPATGNASTVETYSSAACPAGFQGSAIIEAIDPATPAGQTKSNIVVDQMAQPSTQVSQTFTGTFTNPLTNEESGNITLVDGQQFEIGVYCFTAGNATGPGEWASGTFATLSNSGQNYVADQTVTAAPTAVNLTLTASPNPAVSGSSVTLTAHADAANATGTVSFENNGSTVIGTGQLSGGTTSTASFTFTPPTVTSPTTLNLSAVLTTPGTGFTAGNPGTLPLTENPAPAHPTSLTGSIPLAVTVPLSGTFTLTVPTTWVVLTVNGAGTVATAPTGPIVVTDTYNSYPGWSVTGEATPWHGVTNPSSENPAGYPAASDIPLDHGSQSIPADQLGWQPTSTGTLPSGVTVSPNLITPGTAAPNGLGDAFQALATGAPGVGSFTGAGGVTLGANLTLDIPSGQEEGPYAAFLNIDAMSGTP